MTSSSSALQVSLSSTLSTSPFASLDPLIPSTGTGLNLDSSLYALSHEITDEDREPTGQVRIVQELGTFYLYCITFYMHEMFWKG